MSPQDEKVNHSTVPYDAPATTEGSKRIEVSMEDKVGMSEFYIDSTCNGCQEEKRVNDNHLCADCSTGSHMNKDVPKPGYIQGRCRKCTEDRWINAINETCDYCFNDADDLQPNENGFVEPTIVNTNVIDHVSKLGESVAVLQVKFLRRSIAMENMQKMLADPTKYSVYDLFQEAWGGGYLINLNFVEREEWK